MINLIIEPLIGIGNIKLGESKVKIHSLIGLPDSSSNSDESEEYFNYEYYYNDLLISYDPADRINYLEVAGYNSKTTTTELFGIKVFQTYADEIIKNIEESGFSYFKEDREIPYSFVFIDLQLSFWRSTIPEDATIKKELDEDGNGLYFRTVGIGANGYYSQQLLR